MDVAGGTIKNVVFFQGRSRKVVVNSPIEFCDVMNKFIPLIRYLYQPEGATWLMGLPGTDLNPGQKV